MKAGIKLVESTDSITQIRLMGRLDTFGVEKIFQEFHDVACSPGLDTIVDFSRVSFVSSRGMGMLVSVVRKLEEQGAKLVILSPKELVHETLTTTGLARFIPVAFDELSARDLLTG